MLYAIPDKERAAVLVYLSAHAGEYLKNPLKCLSDMLLDNFGWPINTGRRRSAFIIRVLEQSGKVQCRYNARGVLVGVMVVKPNADVKKESLRVEPSPPQTEPEKVVAPPPPDRPSSYGHSANRNILHTPRVRIRKKGVLRRLRKANEKGDRNEERFHRLAERLLASIKELLPGVLWMECVRSGRHRPKKGKIDISDHYGEDVSLKWSVKREAGESVGRIIYQVKSSVWAAKIFNRSIRIFPGQEDALLKKAVVVNDGRPDDDIIGEIRSDLALVGLLPKEIEYPIAA